MKKLNKAIIMALHPECKTWREASEKELGAGCILFIDNKTLVRMDGSIFRSNGTKYADTTVITKDSYDYEFEYQLRTDEIENAEILGLPISLSRVMQALEEITRNSTIQYGFIRGCIVDVSAREDICTWKLTENGKDLYLEDQSEETKKALSKLFNV